MPPKSPPVSLPTAKPQRPARTAAAEPEDEPPGMRRASGSAGFHGVPRTLLIPSPPDANSTVFVEAYARWRFEDESRGSDEVAGMVLLDGVLAAEPITESEYHEGITSGPFPLAGLDGVRDGMPLMAASHCEGDRERGTGVLRVHDDDPRGSRLVEGADRGGSTCVRYLLGLYGDT